MKRKKNAAAVALGRMSANKRNWTSEQYRELSDKRWGKQSKREIGTGRYTFDGNLERLCVCGHPLGAHCATRMKDRDGKVYQECFWGGQRCDSGYDDVACECLVFRPSKSKNKQTLESKA